MSKTPEQVLQIAYVNSIKGMESIYTPSFPKAYYDAAINAMKEYAAQEAGKAWDACFNHLIEDANCGSKPDIHPNKEQYLEQYNPHTMNKETIQAVQLCPRCYGQGIVSKPPWVSADVKEWTSNSMTFTCGVCNGMKVLPIPGAKYASPKWISVEDKLPEEDGYFLVSAKHEGIVVRPFNVYHNCWDGEDGDDRYTPARGGLVTHYMPLPPAPITDKQ